MLFIFLSPVISYLYNYKCLLYIFINIIIFYINMTLTFKIGNKLSYIFSVNGAKHYKNYFNLNKGNFFYLFQFLLFVLLCFCFVQLF